MRREWDLRRTGCFGMALYQGLGDHLETERLATRFNWLDSLVFRYAQKALDNFHNVTEALTASSMHHPQVSHRQLILQRSSLWVPASEFHSETSCLSHVPYTEPYDTQRDRHVHLADEESTHVLPHTVEYDRIPTQALVRDTPKASSPTAVSSATCHAEQSATDLA